jgi:hypothetical protein
MAERTHPEALINADKVVRDQCAALTARMALGTPRGRPTLENCLTDA